MDILRYKHHTFFGFIGKLGLCGGFMLVITVVLLRTIIPPFPAALSWFRPKFSPTVLTRTNVHIGVRKDHFLEVPQIVWGLNNQKIAFARACLTARFLNRTLLMPRLSASLFYKEIDQLQPISFDKLFNFEEFNFQCGDFVWLGRYSDLSNQTAAIELLKGSGRKWTEERDLNQLIEYREDKVLDDAKLVRIVGKNPFLWHDHWPVKDYAKIFNCLVLVNGIQKDVSNVISRIKEKGGKARDEFSSGAVDSPVPYLAVHMRVEKDWMIHCKKLEQRSNIFEICSSREEIMARVARIPELRRPVVVYLAVADSLLEDHLMLTGWQSGLHPFEKKRLGVSEIYGKHPYIIQSAIDFEVCARADVFVGNSFSTFSSLVVLHRTQKMIASGSKGDSCGEGLGLLSYAYNIAGEAGAPKRWTTDMSASSLQNISYGTNNISCHRTAHA